MGCNECTCQCANQRDQIKNMAAHYDNPIVVMNQQTYEAITGNVLMIDGVTVEIDKAMPSRQFLITGEYKEV